MTDRITKVVLRGDVSGLKSSMAAASSSVRGVVGDLKGVEQQNRRVGTSFTALAGVAAGSFVALGVGKLIKDSVTLEAAYSKTMAQVAVATGAPKAELEGLDDLALKLGADTVFSAQDAGSAMLELAKGGLTTAQIKAGALSDTLTLAAAGGLELGDAAGTVVNAMGAFQIKASDTGAAVAALAGAANASSSDVSDITQALAQAGTSAHSAGLSIQETTAYLALFSNQGIKGSDAGTSLRTMLTRLVPQTKQAKDAMAALSLTYVDGNGKLVDATEIAARTQKAFKNLSDEDRIRYANAIFGSDAQRAVNAITAEGAAGLEKYIKQTSDLTQAQKLAKAANSGTAGSIENLKGSIETAEIKIGKGLAPVIRQLAAEAEDFVQHGDLEKWAREGGEAFLNFVDQVTPLAKSLGGLAQATLPAVATAGKATISVLELAADVITPLVNGFNKLPKAAQNALILAVGARTLSNRMGGLPGLAASASGGLVTFGGSAKKAGKDAAEADRNVRTLGGSLKAFGLLAAAAYVIPKGVDLFHQIKGEISNQAPDIDELAASMGRLGEASDETGRLIQASISKTDISRFAGKFGIDIAQLQDGLEKGGTKTGYFADTLKSLRQEFIDTARDGHINFDLGNTVDALSELGTSFDAAHKKAIRVSDDMNDLAVDMAYPDASARGLAARLKALPDEVETKVLTPGAIKSTDDVVKLAKQYKLTPSEVKTVMEAQDFASADVKRVLALLAKTDKKHKAKVEADTSAAEDRMTTLLKLLNQFRSKTIHIDTVTNTIRTDNGRVATPKAEGGIIRGPGTATSDSIPAYLSDGEYVMRAAAVAKYGTHMFDSLNAGRFADGGPVGIPGSNLEWAQQASKADLKWAITTWQKALDKNTEKLSTLKDTMKSFSDTVRDNFRTDGFNQTASDTNGGLSGLTALQYTLASDTANANQFGVDLKKLKAKGISDGLYNALAASGDLTTAGQLASQSRSQIDVTDKLFLARQKATSLLGQQVGTAAYGAQVVAQTAAINAMRKDIHEFKSQLKSGTKEGIKEGMSSAAASGQNRASNSVKGR